VNLLLDENLSPRLVSRITALGAFATHIAHLGALAHPTQIFGSTRSGPTPSSQRSMPATSSFSHAGSNCIPD
jgi:hypothetical protein